MAPNDTNAPGGAGKQDWNKLAKEALDLWQNHLTSLALDPKAKEEMTKFVAPMSQMFAQWSTMMQTGMQTMATAAQKAQASAQAPQSPQTEDHDESTDAADAGSDGDPQPASDATQLGDSEPLAAQPVDAEPVSAQSPVVEPVNAEPVSDPQRAERPASTAEPPAARGRTASPDGARDLAQLAGRLAQLERELDQLRPRPRRRDAEPDAAAAGDVQRVAGTNPGKNTD